MTRMARLTMNGRKTSSEKGIQALPVEHRWERHRCKTAIAARGDEDTSEVKPGSPGFSILAFPGKSFPFVEIHTLSMLRALTIQSCNFCTTEVYPFELFAIPVETLYTAAMTLTTKATHFNMTEFYTTCKFIGSRCLLTGGRCSSNGVSIRGNGR